MDYHKDRFEDFSLMVFKKEELIAILPANKVKDTLYSHQGLTYGSFVLSESTKLFDVFNAFKTLLEFINNKGIKTLNIKMIPSFYNSIPSDELEYILFKANAVLVKRDVLMIIDYRHKLRFQKNRREGINKAKRAGLKVKIDDNYEGFWNEILIPNLSNKHKVSPIHSLEEIQLLAKRFPNNIKQINVYKDNVLVAGTTLFITKTTLHPQYVSGDENKNSYGSLDLLYDFIINEFSSEKRYFDFNISSENNGELINEGLIFWKETCGARTFVSNNYEVKTEAFKTLEIKTT
jgi:hypothetical protein